MSRLIEDNKEYAKLLSSINIAHTGLQRSLSPIDTAHLIKRLIVEQGGKKNAVELLPITSRNMHKYIRLLDLPEQCHDAIIWGKSGRSLG